ncbi:hypothetical protein E2C01_010751 [Portunus trituberculatus]|uniref:Uncharacterized protein n=1 Tax=Portunus trituberculatus TaxID=210409 RepID=A0A5B7D9G9_PORTR|nr:hypothetical protein [Portunus trituberculatus]
MASTDLLTSLLQYSAILANPFFFICLLQRCSTRHSKTRKPSNKFMSINMSLLIHTCQSKHSSPVTLYAYVHPYVSIYYLYQLKCSPLTQSFTSTYTSPSTYRFQVNAPRVNYHISTHSYASLIRQVKRLRPFTPLTNNSSLTRSFSSALKRFRLFTFCQHRYTRHLSAHSSPSTKRNKER